MIGDCTVQARSIGKIIAAASDAGVRPEELYEAVELDPGLLNNPDGRILNAQLVALFEHAARLAGNDWFGLHLAGRASANMFDVLGYAVVNSPTLGEALNRVIRYYAIWTDGSAFDLETGGSKARFTYSMMDSRTGPCRHECEFTLAVIIKISRMITGIDWAPCEVGFQHSRPADTSEHQRIFKSPVRFREPANEIIFDRSLLDLPVATADPTLCAVLDRHAEELLSRTSGRRGVAHEVRRLLGEAIKGGDPGLEAIARKLCMSSRTLQRKLKQEGTSHQALLDEIRREFSMRYLREPEKAISEVAYILGFSEPSAFHRAFKRWTGKTPVEFRRAEMRRAGSW